MNWLKVLITFWMSFKPKHDMKITTNVIWIRFFFRDFFCFWPLGPNLFFGVNYELLIVHIDSSIYMDVIITTQIHFV